MDGPPVPGDPAAPGRPLRDGPIVVPFIELFSLCGLAVAQPLLDVFGRSPEQFVFRNASQLAIVLFGVGLTVLPAVALWTLEVVVGLVRERAREWLHVGLVAVLVALVTILAVKDVTSLRGTALAAVGLVVGAGFAALHARVGFVRLWVRFASVAPVAFLVSFLVLSPVGELLRSGEAEAQQGVEVRDPTPVVMLVFDELPLTSLVTGDGQIDARRYPRFAELAASSAWFRNTTAVSSATWHAIPAMLTGRYPHESGPTSRGHPDNLFTLLGDRYDLAVEESVTRLCPSDLCAERVSAAETFDSLRALGGDARRVWHAQVSPNEADVDPVAGLVEQPGPDGDEDDPFDDFRLNQPSRFERFLDGIGGSDRTTLDYLHVLLPHVPWRYLPSGRQYAHPPNDFGKIDDAWTQESWPVELGRQRHLLQLRYVDRLVGALIDRLRETGLWDEALLVVGADHGVAFQPGEPIRGLEVDHFAEAVHPELMWVPLFVRAPRAGAPHLSDANVETIDVLPTVADVLGVDIPWRVDGVSAFGPGRRTKDKAFFQSKVTPFGVTPGERTTVDGEAGWRLVLERSLPGGTNDQLAPYRVGPSPHLVGRPTDELRSGSETDVVAEVDDPGFVRLVERQSPRIPALVAGRLHGPVNPDDLVVVSVDDVIATVSPSFPWEDDEHAFASLLPEPLLDDGENDISIHLLSADGIARPTRTG